MPQPYAWIPAIVETLSIMAAHNLLPRALQIRLPRLLSAGGSTFRITPSFAAGAALAIMGARFRLAAYRALGTNFKYHLSVLRDHRLATTGPYARVRHPSYTGCFAAYLGVNTAWAARAGWLRGAVWPWLVRDAGTLARVATGAAASAVLGQQLLAVLGLLRRMGEEDGMMRTRFGTEWEEWAARVPYKLISGVY
jgi:protein-S-isoprenylcysteine O-methyltransferase Ste14